MAKILIVDDDVMITTLAESVLTQAGHEVAVRNEALGTSSFAMQFEPDLILMDIVMPALSGEKLAQVLRRHKTTANIPIVLFSAKSDEQLEALRVRTETEGYISKSNIMTLDACIHPYLKDTG